MTSYLAALIVDLVTVSVSLAVLARGGRLSHAHPASIYLFFHVYTVTWRLIALSSGAAPLFSEPFWGPQVEPMREEEIGRAALLADGALLAMTGAWIRAARFARRAQALPTALQSRLRPPVVYLVAAIAGPIGIVGLLLFARVPGIDNSGAYAALGDWGTSSYVTIVQAWAGLVLLALAYLVGFRRWIALPLVAFFGLMAYQGSGRFRLIIPLVLLMQIYLERHGRKWPPLRVVALMAALGLAFYPLKQVGLSLQRGDSAEEIKEYVGQTVSAALSGSAPDQTFLDQFAAYLGLMDEAHTLWLGRNYLGAVTLPIPRQLWPDKPRLTEELHALSQSHRPVGPSGMVMTIIGDMYGNFSYIGIFVVLPLLSYWLARLYFAIRLSPYASVGRFGYLLLACNLLQVYRDGAVSLFVFLFVNMLPLTAIVAIHLLMARRPTRTLAAPTLVRRGVRNT